MYGGNCFIQGGFARLKSVGQILKQKHTLALPTEVLKKGIVAIRAGFTIDVHHHPPHYRNGVGTIVQGDFCLRGLLSDATFV